MSIEAAGRRAGMSPSQYGRIERAEISRPTLEQLCRAGRAVGLDARLQLFPSGTPVRDAGQLGALGRFEALHAAAQPATRGGAAHRG